MTDAEAPQGRMVIALVSAYLTEADARERMAMAPFDDGVPPDAPYLGVWRHRANDIPSVHVFSDTTTAEQLAEDGWERTTRTASPGH